MMNMYVLINYAIKFLQYAFGSDTYIYTASVVVMSLSPLINFFYFFVGWF